MKIACTGATGKVGKLLVDKYSVIPLECDIRNTDEVERAIAKVRPDVICHLASVSDVDWCEKKENWPEVMEVNFTGTRHVVNIANKYNAKVMLLSTDHVFDGKKGNYREDYRFVTFPKNYHRPVNGYGLSKLCAEVLRSSNDNMKVVRTSYLFDFKRAYDKFKHQIDIPAEFPTFMLRSFMYLNHFVDNLYIYCTRFDEMPKVLHLSGSEIVSWYEFGLAVASMLGFDKKLVRPRNKEIKTDWLAPRPHKGGLNVSLSKKLGFPQYSYLDGLKAMKDGK